MSNYEFWDELGRIFNAVVAYQEKSIEFNKRFINPWIRLGNVFDKQDRHREAVGAYQKAAEIDPGNVQNWCDLGSAYFKTDAYDQAIHAFKQAIELNPQFGWPYSNLALIYGIQGDYEQAIQLYKTGIDLLQENKDKAVTWNRLGNLYRKLNEYELAVQAFQKADELDQQNAGFRDELDEAPALPASGKVRSGADLSLEGIASPIQLIVEESQAEDAASSMVGEPAILPSIEDDLADEGGEDLPGSALETTSELENSVQAGMLDPVQSPEQIGRLPEELNLEAEATVLEEGMTVQADGATDQPLAEPMSKTPSPPAAEVAEVVHDVVETLAETLIVTGTPDESSVDSGLAQESRSPVILDAQAVSDGGAPVDAKLKPDVPAGTIEPVSVDPVMGTKSEPAAAPEAGTEVPASLVGINESAPMAAPGLVVMADAADAAPEDPEIVEVVPALPAKVEELEPFLETAPEAAVEAPVLTPVSEGPAVGGASPEPQAASEGPVGLAPEAMQAEAFTETPDQAAEILQHAAYEEFLKEDGEVLNTITAARASDSLPVPPSPVTGEPVTRVDASGEFQIEMDTKNAHVWNELGNVYFNNGAIDDSIVAYSKAIELDRMFAWPYSNLALAYVQKERFAEAVLLYQRSIELFQNEKDKAISWNRLGNVYRRINDYDAAISAYQRADELDPGNTTLSLQSHFSLLGNYQLEQNANLLA